MDYIKTSHVKEKINETKHEDGRTFRLGGNFIEKLNQEVETLIDKALERADLNGRVTVEGKDL